MRTVYLVGTVPLANTEEVLRTLGGAVGPALRWVPDGETGERLAWLPWLDRIFASHASFEQTDQIYQRTPGETSRTAIQKRYRLKAGHPADALVFNNLPHADFAIESYGVFSKLKNEGVLPRACKLQVDFAGIVSVMRRFVVPEDQQAVGVAYEKGLKGEVDRMLRVIPKAELAIQWDVASAVFQHLEENTPTVYGKTREEMMEAFSTWHAKLGEDVPSGVDLMYHLCYGDQGHRHSVEPSTAALLVEFSNRLTAKIKRPIALIHMPVPRSRFDDAYYAPLADLKLQPQTKLALGLVHLTDGVEGTRRRMAVADKYVKDYAIGTECGFGRRAAESIGPLMEVHALAAGVK
jgi:hypothetical protein